MRYFNAYVLFPYLEKKSGRKISDKLFELRNFEKQSFEARNSARKKALYDLLIHCQKNIPYYQELFQKTSFDVDKVLQDLKYIQDLPLLTKEIVRENVERIRLPGAHHVRKTGGSTGQSVFFYYDDDGLDWTSAINMRAYEMAGNYPHKKDCHISSELGIDVPTMRDRIYDWVKLQSQNRSRLMIRSFSDADLDITVRDLKRIRPYLLQGHPSSAYAMATYIKKMGFKKKVYCDVFEPSGEALSDKMVDLIEEQLGCTVMNRYGNAEAGVMAHSLMGGSYKQLKIFERAFYIEEGDQTPIVVTSLTNYSFPLIRYNTGDIATVRHGGDGDWIYDIQGRIHDLVRIGDEEYATHFLMDYMDHKIKGVREFQILLKDGSLPVLRVVAENENDQDRIFSELKKRWPSGLEIEFVAYEELMKVGWQQKFRHVIELRG